MTEAKAVCVAERFAEGSATPAELATARRQADQAQAGAKHAEVTRVAEPRPGNFLRR